LVTAIHDSVKKTDIRSTYSSSEQALVKVVLLQPDYYQHVHVLVASSTGAGPSHIKVGFGIGFVDCVSFVPCMMSSSSGWSRSVFLDVVVFLVVVVDEGLGQ
jgi:hypothetical protein